MALFLRLTSEKHHEEDLQQIRRLAPGGGNGVRVGHGRVRHHHVCICRHLVHRPRPFDPRPEVSTGQMRD